MENVQGISRRNFVRGSLLGAAALAGASVVSGRVPMRAYADEAEGQALDPEFMKFFEESMAEYEPIEIYEEGGEFDVIVIGAGTSGIPCAVRAYQEGASVLLLQKESSVVAQGNSMSGVLLDKSDPEAIKNFLYLISADCCYRNDLEQMKVYVYNSGDASAWYMKEINDSGYKLEPFEKEYDYGALGKMVIRTGRCTKPDNQRNCLISIMNAYEDKVTVRYNTPAVQLVKEGSKVTGVFAKDRLTNTYYKFTALKGVVIATGDYQNSESMCDAYCPDVKGFERKQIGKTGDGHLMGMLAGAVMEPLGHTKMVHDGDTGPMVNEPFLKVDMNGKRFINEIIGVEFVNNYLRNYPAEQIGRYCEIWDAEWFEKATEWGGNPDTEEAIRDYMPEEEVENRKAYVNRIATYKADTLEELAEKLGIPADTFVESVKRFNEMCDAGFDDDFGLEAKYLKKIETPPFYGTAKQTGISALCSGIIVNKDFEVLDADRNPIENLYALGNCSGPFYACPDYPLRLGGMSVARCVTGGYLLGSYLAKK